MRKLGGQNWPFGKITQPVITVSLENSASQRRKVSNVIEICFKKLVVYTYSVKASNNMIYWYGSIVPIIRDEKAAVLSTRHVNEIWMMVLGPVKMHKHCNVLPRY